MPKKASICHGFGCSVIKNLENMMPKLEAICILLRKPVLCKQKDFDYTVSLFS